MLADEVNIWNPSELLERGMIFVKEAHAKT